MFDLDLDWGDISMYGFLIVLFTAFSLMISNNYIDWHEYSKQSKLYNEMYPPITTMNNGVQYQCTFNIEQPTLAFDFHFNLHYWYIYLLSLFILLIIGWLMLHIPIIM